MALLDGLPLESDPGGPATYPWEPESAQAARDVAAARLRRSSGRRGYDPLSIEGPPDAALMDALNANPGMVNSGAAASPAIIPPAAAAPAPSPAAIPSPASAPASPAPFAPDSPAWPGMLAAPFPSPAMFSTLSATAASPASLPAAPAAVSPQPSQQAPAVPESSLFGRIGNAFNRIGDAINNRSGTLMALGAGMAGAQNIGQGLQRGLAMAGPAMQADIQQERINQSLPIIRDRLMKTQGLSAEEANGVAMAAISNPAIMQQLVPGLFGAKQRQFTQIGEDMLGNKRFGFVDPVNAKVYDLSGRELTGETSGGPTVPTGSDGQPLSGQALLTHLEKTDPVTAAGVKGLIEGNISSSGRNLQKLAPLASLIDPTFDAAQYPVRLATRKNYTSGKQFQEIQAINTVAGHLDNLSRSAEELNNTRFPWWNWAANTALQATGDPRVDKFNADKQAVTNELSKAYRGGHVTEGDVREWQQNISAAKSPQQLKAVIGEFNDLLMSKRKALEDGYRSSMGKAPLPDEFSSVSDHARDVFNRVADWSHGVSSTSAQKTERAAGGEPAAPGFKPKPGATYRYDPASGRFIEAK